MTEEQKKFVKEFGGKLDKIIEDRILALLLAAKNEGYGAGWNAGHKLAYSDALRYLIKQKNKYE